jgi:hypothetical protein
MSRPKKNEEPITEAAKDATILAAEIRSSDMSATEALVAGISACGNIQATRVNPHFRSRYFGLGDLLAQVKPTLASYGLVILQVPYTSEDRISVKTEILHGKSGQRFDFGELGIKAAGLNLQATGSALSYLKRYAIATIVGVASDDETEDDGNAASRPIQHTAPKAQAAAQPAAKPAWFIAAGITTPQAQEVAAELLRRKGWLGAGDGLQELDEAKIAALHQGRMLQTFVDAIRAQLETPNA